MIRNRLPQLIVQKGISIRQLARETGVTYTTVRAMVHGERRSVQIEVLDAVCGALGVQPGDIYKRVGSREESAFAPEKRQPPGPEARGEEQPAQPARETKASEWRNW